MTAPMKKVPQNSGTAPSVSPGSVALITCGLQRVPNRKSVTGTIAKKRALSNRSETKMPTVVRIAISDATSSASITVFSTRVRARNCGWTRV